MTTDSKAWSLQRQQLCKDVTETDCTAAVFYAIINVKKMTNIEFEE